MKNSKFEVATEMLGGVFKEKRARLVQGAIVAGVVVYTILIALR